MGARFQLSDLPLALQKQVAEQLYPAGGGTLAPKQAVASPIRQKRAPALNKLETSFLGHLRAIHGPPALILSQAITLRLGNGVRYTPDFVLHHPDTGLTAYETKGPRFWDDAKVKLKVAADLYPWISFFLAQRPKNGAWQITRVLR